MLLWLMLWLMVLLVGLVVAEVGSLLVIEMVVVDCWCWYRGCGVGFEVFLR